MDSWLIYTKLLTRIFGRPDQWLLVITMGPDNDKITF